MVETDGLKQGDALPPFVVGDITRERMVAIMGVMGDTNPIHEDPELARRLGFRGIVNQGPANMAYVVNMLVGWAGDPTAITSLRFRFHDNVVPGDRLTARGEIAEIRRGPAATEVDCDFRLDAEDGRVRLSGAARMVMPRA